MRELIKKEQGFNVSDRYKVIDTKEVLKSFQDNGYQVESVSYAGVRNKLKEGYQKHLVRMSHPSIDWKINGLRPEIILKNSYDGSSCFNLTIGVYRFLCANGLEVGSSFQSESVRHVGREVLNKVLEAAEKVQKNLPLMEAQIEAMSSTDLSMAQIDAFAYQIGQVLTLGKTNIKEVMHSYLASPCRPGDSKRDVFTVLNVIQENALKGRYKYLAEVPNKNNPEVIDLKMRRARKIKSLTKTSQINQIVWNKGLELIGA